jgi:signal transduction histidine kinase
LAELLELTGDLAQARTREDIARATIEKASRTVGAVSAGLWTLTADGTHVELLAVSEADRAVVMERFQRIPVAGDTPVAVAVRTREPFFLGSLDAYGARFPESRARLDSVRGPTHVAFAILPLVAGDTPVGALTFAYPSEREFDEAGRTYKLILARHCALAIARVQLLERERAQREDAERAAASEKHARGDVELLYELIASFNRLDDIDAVYDLALRSVLRISRSNRAAILLFDRDNVMRFRAHVGLSDTYRAAVEGHSPWKPDEKFPAPIAVDDTEIDPAWEAYRPVFRAEGIRALAFVPIVHQRKLIGKFMLYRDEPRPFAPRDLQLASTVAVHVAQAVERKQHEQELARAYREEREAHFEAEEAARAREEILSVVSHDLRNPLGAIMMGATTLLVGDPPPRVRTSAERIQRQAERMARLIEDLVDFAGIQAGKLALERGHHPPEAILTTTSDIFGPIAQERGLKLETRVTPGLPAVACDSDRAVQVLSNLVSNALKVTPKGGAIAIGAEPKGDRIVFYVRDTGPGIAPDELPNLFERYWRGKHSYKGTGLGLSIARGIVDAHGGRIWAESSVGAGSTFYFSLHESS